MKQKIKINKLFIKSLTLFVLMLFLQEISLSQIVNIESKRSNSIDSINWNGSAMMGFNLSDNGKRLLQVSGNLRLEHSRGPHLFLSISDIGFGKINDSGFENSGFQHLRYNYTIKDRFVWEVFNQIQYNERIKLKARYLAGTGPRFGLVHKAPFYVYAGIMYMYEYDEEVYGDPETSHFFNDHRLSSYLSFTLQPLSQLSIISTSYYQPVITNFEDLRLSSVSTLLLKVTEKILFTNTFSISYDSRTPEGIPNTIYKFSSGIKLKF